VDKYFQNHVRFNTGNGGDKKKVEVCNKNAAEVCTLTKKVHNAGDNSRDIGESQTVFIYVEMYGSCFAIFIFKCCHLAENHSFIEIVKTNHKTIKRITVCEIYFTAEVIKSKSIIVILKERKVFVHKF